MYSRSVMTMPLAREDESVVFVVDDDDPLRDAIAGLLRLDGIRVECFGTAQEFLKQDLPDIPSCLVLDVRLPGVSGLSVQTELADAAIQIPIIFMTAHGDIPMTVRAMKAGAVEFLTKPFRDQDLLDAVHLALQKDRARRGEDRALARLRENFVSLTSREREILTLVSEGLMNKQIAAKTGLAEITVKIHRGNLSRKMGARSVVELVKMAQALGVQAEKL